MAEVLGGIASTITILEQAVKLTQNILQAKTDLNELPDVLQRHEESIKEVEKMLVAVDKEPGLQSEGVQRAAANIGGIAIRLTNCLNRISGHLNRSKISSFSHQVFKGSLEKRQLDALLVELDRGKGDLGRAMTLVNVGMSKTNNDILVVNTTELQRTNQVLQDALGSDFKLRLASQLEGRPANPDGTVPLKRKDLYSMTGVKDALPGDDKPVRVREIHNNSALEGALQVNTPVGKDIWADMNVVSIRDNFAGVNASQINYPISEEAFMAVLNSRTPQAVPGYYV